MVAKRTGQTNFGQGKAWAEQAVLEGMALRSILKE